MADGTNIEWTDATWQIVTGCKVISPGCTNCYAMKLAGTRLRNIPSRKDLTIATKAGPVWNGMVRFNVGWLMQPLRWRKPRDIFVAAHGDLFHDAVQRWMLLRTFTVMALAKQHRFQVLTKRPENMLAFLLWLQTDEGRAAMEAEARKIGYSFEYEGHSFLTLPLPNVWLGVSVEDQPRAEERVPVLLQTPAAVRWVSAEPLLGALDLRQWVHKFKGDDGKCDGPCCEYPRGLLHWLVSGGESGPGARPAHPDWFRSLRDQCAAAGVPYFHKQNGAWVPGHSSDERDIALHHDGTFRTATWLHGATEDERRGVERMKLVGKKAAGAKLDGVEWRQFPNAR